jgi:hypothetical protein
MKHGIFALIVLLTAACARETAVDTTQVTAAHIAGPLPLEDPESSAWNRAVEHPARLMVQDIAEPRLTTPGVELVRVRALHDGRFVVFRLEWVDATRDLMVDSGRSSDAAAIQFPVAPGEDVPNAAMGERAKSVQICYWKALWQDDAARAASGGPDRVGTLYPNMSIDHYPAQANPAAREEMERRYAPAAAAGNPITARDSATPVQELIAEGFGTTTAAPTQKATGRGTWRDGRWLTTIARPLSEGAGLANLQAGRKTYVAFAVWDGASQHMGSRKMRSGWVPFVLEER